MKSKLSSFVLSAVLLLVVCSAFASAAVTFAPTSISTTALHNSQASISFTLAASNDSSYDSLSWANGTTSIGSWSFPSLGSITNGTTSSALSAAFTVPQYTLAGTIISTSIIVKNGTAALQTLPVTITVNSTPSLSVSASSSSVSVTQNSTITVTNTGNTVLLGLNVYSSNSAVATSISSISTLNPGNSTTFKAYAASPSTLALGNPAASTITVNNTAAGASAPVSAQASYCSSGDIGTNLTITGFEISKTDEDYTWMPLQAVEVRFTINNNNPDTGDSSNKITTYAAVELYSSTGKKYLSLDKLKVGTINAGNDKLAKFNFTVPADVKDGTAYLYIKAYQSGKESQICTSQVDSVSVKPITISRQSDDDKQIAITDVTFDQQPAFCGTDTIMTMKVYNVGDRDQTNVKVSVFNKELGISAYAVLSDLNQGDESDVSFPITIPLTVAAKTYPLDLKVRYDVKSDVDTSLDSSYDYVKLYNPALIVTGAQCAAANTTTPGQAASITAEFSPETPKAIIGQQVIIDATLKNTGTSAASYTIDVAGNSQWSSVASIDPKTFTLNAGESKKVSIYLDINGNATESNKEFTIKASYGNSYTEQKVQIALEKGITTSTIMNHLKKNWFIYVVVLVNLILIIAIILVVRSLMRKQ